MKISLHADLAMPYAINRYEGESHDAMGEIRELRKLCWASLYAAGATLEDGFDGCALHWVASDEKGIVAAARLTIHDDLVVLPESHLFTSLRSSFCSFPLGYMSRLVVHPRMRGRGLAAHLDAARIKAAVELGCIAMVGTWTPMSGEHRRRQLFQTGFESLDGDTPRSDELFGVSYVYFMSLCTDDGHPKGTI